MRAPAAARRWLLPVVAVAVVAVAACSSDDDSASQPTTTRPAPSVFPLRGTPVEDAGVASRPALVVKVDTLDAARPQAGLADADLVIEEKVEGPFSRLAVVFHARQPDAVGPVRSGRTTDIGIVSSLNRPLFAFSGANPTILGQLRAAPLVDVGPDVAGDAYERLGDRTAPYNLWASPERLRHHTPPDAGPPPAAFTWGDRAPSGAAAAAEATYDFGPTGTRVSFAWDAAAGGWVRTQNGTRHVDTEGDVLAPANVIVQLVEYVDTGDRDVAGTPVPEARLVGNGDAWVLTRGVAVKATWSKPDVARPTTYEVPGSGPVPLAPGQTWVALVPMSGVAWGVSGPGGPLN